MRFEVQDKRGNRRLRPHALGCSMGRVVDLSTTGMRLLAKRQLRGSQALTIKGPDNKPIRLRAQVVWHRRHAAGEHVHGLRFEQPTQEQLRQLHALTQHISHGLPLRQPPSLAGFAMVTAGFLCTAAWYAWTRKHDVVENLAPALADALAAVPGLDAILIIAAVGFAAVGLIQRFSPTPAGAQQAGEEPATSPVPAQPIAPPSAEEELETMRRSQGVLNCILESSLGGVCVIQTIYSENREIDGFLIQLINPAGEELLGKTEHQLVGRTLEQCLPELIEHELYRDLIRIVEDGTPIQKEYQVGDDGRWYLVAMVRLADGIAVTFLDHTETREHREQLQHIAYHDELTGLPNRKALIEHVDTSIGRTRRAKGHRSALLFLDFDRFKHVNDTLGHEAGDQLLIGIAQRLRDNLRESDSVGLGAGEHIPARLGGDEFVVLLDGITGTADAVAVAQRLLKVFAQPHEIAGQDVVSTASIGIAINDGKYESADDILRDADAAMYTAKQNGKGRYVLFDQDMHDQMLDRLRMEKDLRHAVERDQLALVYEPIIDLASGRTAGFETLVRWNHPGRGAVSPAVFIPLAEDLNLIGQIGEWVVQQACAQLAEWRRRGIEPVFINVNVSRGQLYEPNLVEMFREQVEVHGLDPSDLRIELTETMVMNDLDFMADKLNQLKQLGLGLALDDFGTGYSSLSVLHKLPFDTLKIDRAFLDDARAAHVQGQTRRSSAILSAITELAEHLQLDVIAEGIAEPEQVATLQALACRYAQGWHFSKPLDADAAFAMANDPRPHTACLAAQLSASA